MVWCLVVVVVDVVVGSEQREWQISTGLGSLETGDSRSARVMQREFRSHSTSDRQLDSLCNTARAEKKSGVETSLPQNKRLNYGCGCKPMK
jgi:hypothetical protein